MRRRRDYPSKASDLRLAPEDLGIVQAFVNTADRGRRGDEWSSPAALAAWLTRWRLAAGNLELAAADLERAVEVREALRELLAANNGGPTADEAVVRLDRVASETPVAVRFTGDGTHLAAHAPGLAGALARIFAIVAAAHLEGVWPRLKACAAADCRAVFYDTSSNLAGKWCSMRRCGNRRNARRSQRQRKQYWAERLESYRAARAAGKASGAR